MSFAHHPPSSGIDAVGGGRHKVTYTTKSTIYGVRIQEHGCRWNFLSVFILIFSRWSLYIDIMVDPSLWETLVPIQLDDFSENRKITWL